MSRNRYSSVKVLNGEVISTDHSDWFEETSFEEMVANIQRNARTSYWEVLDTDTGVVHVTRQGLVTVWTVQVEV